MKRCLVALYLCASLFSIAQPQGVKIETVGHIPLEQFPGNPAQIADIWGYTDPQGRKFALVGKANGLTIFDISTPETPAQVADFDLNISDWKDVKTFVTEDGRAYAFATADNAAGVGLTVVDITNLPESATLIDHFPLFEEAHNLFIDPNHQDPYAYIAITQSDEEAGLMIIDISEPTNPTRISHFQPGFGVHDLYVSRNWANPAWNGKELGVLFSEGAGIVVVDLTDKTNPAILSQTRYEGLAYAHSGWADKTGRYIYAFDELDESGYGHNTLVRTFDMFDPTAPVLVDTWEAFGNDIDHNGIVKGDRLYMSHYTAGLTVLDISNPADPQLAGNTYPFQREQAPSFNGYWGVYPLFEDDLVICSDINNGLVVLRVTDVDEPEIVYGPHNLKLCAESDTPNDITVSLFAGEQVSLPLTVVEAPPGIDIQFPKNSISTGETLKIQVAPTVNLPPETYQIILAAGEQQMTVDIELIGRDAVLDIFMPVNGEVTMRRDGGLFYWLFNKDPELYQFSLWSEPNRSDILSLPWGRNYIDMSGYLEPDKTYFWQVQAQGLCDTVTSEVYSFTTGGARILYVADFGFDYAEAQRWSSLVNFNGLRVEFRNPSAPGFLDDIADFDAVIWYSGNTPDTAGPTASEETLLTNYLDNGGKLILSAAGYYEARGSTTEGFIADYLGVSSISPNVTTFTNLKGSGYAGSIVETPILPDFELDVLTPSASGQTILSDTVTGDVVAVATDNTLFMTAPILSMQQMFSPVQLLEAFYLEHLTLERSSGIFQQYIPMNPTNAGTSPSLYLYNHGDSVNAITVEAIDYKGRVISRTQPTLLAKGMVGLSYRDITGAINIRYNYLVIHSNQPFSAMMEGTNPEIGFALEASTDLAQTLYVPHVAADTASFFTTASIVNASFDDATVSFNTHDDGSWNLDFNSHSTGQYLDFSEILGGVIDQAWTRGAFHSSAGGLIGAEVFGANDHGQIAGLTLTGQSSHQLYFNHIADADNDWWTGLTAYNPGTETATIAAEVYAADGQRVATGVIQLGPGERLIDAVTNTSRAESFFPDGIPANGAWVKLDSSQPLVGYTLFSDNQYRLFAGLEASTQATTELILPFVGNEDRYAGVAFVNDSDSEQVIQLTLRNGSGVFQGSASVTVPAHGRVAKSGEALFGAAINGSRTYAEASASNGIHAFVIYGDKASNWLAGINAFSISN